MKFIAVAPGRAYHGALPVLSATRGGAPAQHTHDFHEFMYVLRGQGTHWIYDQSVILAPGDLLLIRPQDRHAVTGAPASTLQARGAGRDDFQFANVAFPTSAWRRFSLAAGLEAQARDWEAAQWPPSLRLAPELRAATAAHFDRAVHVFLQGPAASDRLELCQLWTQIVPLMLEAGARAVQEDTLPPWLAQACRAMTEPENLRAGVPRLVELCHVSPSHLSRTMKAGTGRSPTEVVNNLRLQRAAVLLATTAREIGDIADSCGFTNLSHFYHLFGAQFGQTPRAYRLTSRRAVAP